MPRKKLARRFEPRFGVSQIMLDIEAGWIAKELEDYLLASLSDLRGKLQERQNLLTICDETLSKKLSALPEREQLALRCMLARDFHHIGQLYETYFRSRQQSQATSSSCGIVHPVKINQSSAQPAIKSILPFKESLFDF